MSQMPFYRDILQALGWPAFITLVVSDCHPDTAVPTSLRGDYDKEFCRDSLCYFHRKVISYHVTICYADVQDHHTLACHPLLVKRVFELRHVLKPYKARSIDTR